MVTDSLNVTSTLSINDNNIIVYILELTMIDPPSSVYTLWQEGFTNEPTLIICD